MSKNSQSNSYIEIMREGGLKLRQIKVDLQEAVKVGSSFESIEQHAQSLIAKAGGQPNFAMVPDYHWATCIMKNAELCHGIPKHKYVDDGDVITIDVGMLYKGWHLDTSISFGVGDISEEAETFLQVGKQSLKKSIGKARVGNSIYEVSSAMQRVVERAGYSAAYQLTGHGIGKELHMEPSIPCIADRGDKRIHLKEGQTVAIEIMYAAGDATVVLDKDGWTYRTKDGSLSAMFEETVLVTANGPEILT